MLVTYTNHSVVDSAGRASALTGHKTARDEVIDALRGRALLLLLDNCEHLIEPVAALIDGILGSAPRVHVLATSQNRLKVLDEHLYRLQPLTVPTGPDLASARESGAVLLFVDRVVALRPDFELAEHNCGDVAHVCRRLDGLPLAIELAAARVPLLGVSGVVERLDDRFRLLTGGAHTGFPRHQTLREALAWSHGLLTEDERKIFRRASIFAGGFTLRAAQLALGDRPEAMRAVFEATHAAGWNITAALPLEQHRRDLDNLRQALDWAGTFDNHLHIALAGASAWLWSALANGSKAGTGPNRPSRGSTLRRRLHWKPDCKFTGRCGRVRGQLNGGSQPNAPSPCIVTWTSHKIYFGAQLALYRTQPGANVGICLGNLCAALTQRGDVDDALAVAQEAVKLDAQLAMMWTFMDFDRIARLQARTR